ncbi:MAG: CRISPR system precrRNA processing endoribonuclease RAMP protein Cas6 [Candidatus Korarchaeum sp.]
MREFLWSPPPLARKDFGPTRGIKLKTIMQHDERLRLAKLYTFEMEFIERAELPRWKGNIIRGAIGANLLRRFCLYDGDCGNCSMLLRCPYGYLFEAKSKGIVLRKLEGFTKPYVLKPPLSDSVEFSEGDPLSFSVVLFGDAVGFEKQLLSAVIEMGRRGIGRRERRGRVVLKQAFVENPFSREKGLLYDGKDVYEPRVWIRESDIGRRIGRIFKLRFLTPFMLMKDGKLLRELEFGNLFPFMLRKYSAILQQYVGAMNIDVRKAIRESMGVRLLSDRISEVNFKYKGEDQTFLTGELLYSGSLRKDARKPLLFCQLSHIGKRSSFGFGWYEVLSLSP